MRKVALLLLSLLALSCGKTVPEFTGMDWPAWKNDRNGCTGSRMTMEVILRQQKDKLLALSETQIVGLLGKPDQNELYKRNQKFYRYLLSAGKSCPEPDANPMILSIRFSAMGLAQEVLITRL